MVIAALTSHVDTPPRTVTPITPRLDRFDGATFTWAGNLGADATVPAHIHETNIFDIPQSRAASAHAHAQLYVLSISIANTS